MGSIAGLRSEAMALRSKENTGFEVSAYLGTVNKSLGTQITGMIDQLQSTILDRTKAYNQGISSLKKSLEGKNGICDQMLVSSFQAMSKVIEKFSAATGSAWGLLGVLVSAITGQADKVAMEAKIKADMYNYEKALSQLGFTRMDPQQVLTGSVPLSDAGATSLLNKRDALSPRYKPKDINRGTGSWIAASKKNGNLDTTGYTGYVGTLRKV